MKKVLMILNHAPDYRESFLSELAKNVQLTVIAQPCFQAGMKSPKHRGKYKYYEIEPIIFFGLIWQKGLYRIINLHSWDIICASANLRVLSNLFLFFINKKYWSKWVWWGHVFGKSKSKILGLFRKKIIDMSAGCLTHSKIASNIIKKEYKKISISFNNTEVSLNEFRNGKFNNHYEIRLLFVGRYQKRKRIERLVNLAERRNDIHIRLVGPGMGFMNIPETLITTKRIQIFDYCIGKNLVEHFDWADIVANPGHAGLLILNAARHGKGIVIDSNSEHAPEIELAIEAKQPFISFENNQDIDHFIDIVHNYPLLLREWSKKLQKKAKEKYTIETMIQTHLLFFNYLYKKSRQK